MRAMTMALCGLLAMFPGSVVAEDNEAETLFRAMQKKIMAANAFEVTFTYHVGLTGTSGELLVTKGNQMRLKIKPRPRLLGRSRRNQDADAAFEVVSDGKLIRTRNVRMSVWSNGMPAAEPGGQSEWPTPKNFHDALGVLVCRGGLWFTVFIMPYLPAGDGARMIEPDKGSKMQIYDFKLDGAEKVGEHQAKVIRYRFGKGDGCRDDEEITLWIDARTLLPLQRSFTLKKERVPITEIYQTFKVDPPIVAGAFELPAKAPAPASPDDNVEPKKLPVRDKDAAGGVFNVRYYGATGDGNVLDTAAILRAIDACHAAGGGQVLLPPGKYLSATLRLQSHVTLKLDAGATLIGCKDPEAYSNLTPPSYMPEAKWKTASRWHRALIVGDGAEDIAVVGPGTIDGNKVFDPKGEERRRGPHTILLGRCRDVTFRDLTIRDSANYAIFLEDCSQVKADRVSVTGGWDGFHFRGAKQRPCRDVTISGCQFYTGDDCIAGRYWEDVLITGCVFNSSCNGVRLIGPAKHLIIHDCLIFGPGRFPHTTSDRRNMLAGLSLQPGAWDATEGEMDDVLISDITMRNVAAPFYFLLKRGNQGGHISVNRVNATGVYLAASSIESWSQTPFEQVTFRDVSIECAVGGRLPKEPGKVRAPSVDPRPLPAWGFYAKGIKDLRFENVRLTHTGGDPRPVMQLENISRLTQDGLRFPTNAFIVLSGVEETVVRDADGPSSAVKQSFGDSQRPARVTTPRLVLVAGGGSGPDGSPAAQAELRTPFGVDFDRSGNMYIVEFTGHRVRKLNSKGIVTTVAGTGEKGSRGDGGPARDAQFNSMHGLAIAPDGDLYIADTWNNRVRKIEARSGLLSTIAGTGEKGYSGDGGPAAQARFGGVYSIALAASARHLYIADLDNRRIRKIDLHTQIVTTVAGNGKRGVPKDGAAATESPLVDPRAVAVDTHGNVYILERSGHALRVVNSQGKIRTVAGTGKAGATGDGGDALQATLNGPKHLCIDRNGAVIIADTANHVIRRYEVATGKIVRVAGSGKKGRGAPGAPPQQVDLDEPHGVIVDSNGVLYIADSNNHRILRLEP
jgi:outer membrane lipoprotein-sorting protein